MIQLPCTGIQYDETRISYSNVLGTVVPVRTVDT